MRTPFMRCHRVQFVARGLVLILNPQVFLKQSAEEVVMKSNVKADRTARLGALALLVTIASPSITVAGQIDTSAAAKYPRYRMVVLGTLGGPSSAPNAPAVSLNNRGQIVAQA